MRYLGLLGLLIAVAIMLYLSAPRIQEAAHPTTYNAATGAAQHAAGAAEQHVRDIMSPLSGAKP